LAVYTKLAAAEIKSLVNQYDIGEMKDFRGIEEGSENTNYLIQASAAKHILTIYEKRVQPEDLPFFLKLTEHLADRGIPCPRPVHDKNGNVLKEIKGKNAAIVSFLNGKSVSKITPTHCQEVGEMLAKMHLAADGFPLQRHNNIGKESWRELFGKIAGRISEIPEIKSDIINQALDKLDNEWPANLPAGIIHADLFPDNVFFTRDKLTGVIDFYFACNDFLAYDLAICVNAWCFNAEWNYLAGRAEAMFAGYDSVRKITPKESENFPILLLGAALRFLLTRTYDWLNPLTRKRDPQEYWQKLNFFLNQRLPQPLSPPCNPGCGKGG